LAALNITTDYIAIFGLVFSVAGLAFKLGAAPFHMWVPDVYDGAPTSVTLFIATAPKIAGFGMAIRLLVGAMPSLHVQWVDMLIVISLLSMGIGNFAALIQTNIKRLLAYSSIAHAGYALLGIICVTPRGYAASMFYIITYAIMTLGAFGIVLLLNQAGFEVESIDDLKSLNNRHPWMAFMMLIVMFSLAGVPPLVGFIAKVGLLEALIDVHLVWLAVLAIIFAIIGAYYYLRVVKVMYFEKTDVKPELMKIHLTSGNLIAISLNGLAVLVLGILPGALFTLCHMAFTV
jgi:NADH-quinone oxidoreductase subunit N